MTMILDGTLGITATGSLTGLTTAITPAQGGTGLTAVGSSGNLLTSNGTAWTSTAPAAAGGMTLLGTVSATSGNSVSLGSLDLTSYTELHIAMKSVVSSGGVWNFVTSTNSQSAAYSTFYTATSSACSGIFIFNLVTGSFVGTTNEDTAAQAAPSGAGLGNITTASTTIYFRLASTNTYSGSGSFKVYGVK